MNATLNTALRVYLLGTVWLLAMSGVVAVSFEPLGSFYSLVGLDDVLLRSIATMTIAITAASLVTALLSKPSIRPRRWTPRQAVRLRTTSEDRAASVDAPR